VGGHEPRALVDPGQDRGLVDVGARRGAAQRQAGDAPADELGVGSEAVDARAGVAVAEERDLAAQRRLAAGAHPGRRERQAPGAGPAQRDRTLAAGAHRRAPVDPPRHAHVQDIGDRRQDVDRPDLRVDDPAGPLAGRLHEQRHGDDVRAGRP
jgi:hypothetical protein